MIDEPLFVTVQTGDCNVEQLPEMPANQAELDGLAGGYGALFGLHEFLLLITTNSGGGQPQGAPVPALVR